MKSLNTVGIIGRSAVILEVYSRRAVLSDISTE
jgi:hypothetical protein